MAAKIQWELLTCRETTGYDERRQDYTRCGLPAEMIILHHKDQTAYPMCRGCASHNTHNRGGVVLAHKS